jgi:hypothetical protein
MVPLFVLRRYRDMTLLQITSLHDEGLLIFAFPVICLIRCKKITDFFHLFIFSCKKTSVLSLEKKKFIFFFEQIVLF